MKLPSITAADGSPVDIGFADETAETSRLFMFWKEYMLLLRRDTFLDYKQSVTCEKEQFLDLDFSLTSEVIGQKNQTISIPIVRNVGSNF